MSMQWSAPVTADFWDAYLDWSRLLQTRRATLLPPDPDGHDWFEPIFVRLRPQGQTSAMGSARKALAARVNDAADPLVMDPLEYARLAARIADPTVDKGLPDEYALYRRLNSGTTTDATLFELLDVGSTVDLDLTDMLEAVIASTAKPRNAAPIVAIIDDGIGFLNTRFRRNSGAEGGHETRFHAVWLQSLERLQKPAGGQRRAHLGRILTATEIDAMLAQGSALDEPATYAELNAELYGQRGHRSTEFGQSHGTHVLDLAAGADPDDATETVRDWPLLAVQLPPEAIEDTSGTRFESYMVQGLRWILKQAQMIDPKAPVIVNLSMGMLAGPKNGTRFAEYQIAREARLWETITGQPVRIVWSFGNNWRSRQVATFDYPHAVPRHATDRQITWRSQPDDLTASYLEVHCDSDTASTDLELSLTSPDGISSGFVAMAPGSMRSLELGGEAVARIYHVPEHVLEPGVAQRACYMLALGPTNAQIAGEAIAPSGAWTVAVRYCGSAAARISLQIQRGESLPDYAPRGRQSYFDDTAAYAWDAEQQDWSGLGPDCPIRRDGSLNALTTMQTRQVFCVGAAEWYAADGTYRPSVYTSEGAVWTTPGPVNASTRADDSRIFWGVLASGTYSGSARLLNGTSAAAGRLTRALARSAEVISANAAQGGGTQMDDLDPTALVLAPTAPEYAARLGIAVVDMQDGARPRL
ncbi:S8 family serine peptidase [Puniceibacterium sp. IMCC21224]|uniref:S8 family serine peptidase n=1 Tax=Puniceibacterium sp. IMCC21224 TaxID=1618204 RepID=UPI00065D7724|nr:S8 family serine peptidase [Puniceibacterium sp. IMCC21224]KMK65762.1 subtilase family protease [Puniceibacterium sp. IMCC21224]